MRGRTAGGTGAAKRNRKAGRSQSTQKGLASIVQSSRNIGRVLGCLFVTWLLFVVYFIVQHTSTTMTTDTTPDTLAQKTTQTQTESINNSDKSKALFKAIRLPKIDAAYMYDNNRGFDMIFDSYYRAQWKPQKEENVMKRLKQFEQRVISKNHKLTRV